MANRVKGITIEIGGNTTKLQDSLKAVDRQLKETQAKLKDVDKLLKLDPGNTDLLTQKQKYLNNAIKDTEEKLRQEKTALEQLKAGPQTEETARQQEALTREIVETEHALESLTDQYKTFGSVASQQVAAAGEKLQEVGGKVEGVGKALMPLSAAAAGALAGGIAAAKELDEGYDTIITKTGATGEALEELTGVADKVFGSIPTTMDKAGTAVGEINTRFGVTGDRLEELSTLFIQFSEINGIDLNNSIGAVDKVMERFGIDASRTAEVLGLLTVKGQETGISVDQLLSSLQTSGSTMRELGLGLEESVALLAQFEANGVDAGTAIAGLRKSVAAYTKEGLSADEAIRATLESVRNAKTETEALAIAQETFGTKGAAEMAEAIRTGKIDLDALSVSMEQYGTTVQDTFAATLDPWDEATVAVNNLKLAGAELGSTLMQTLAPMLQAASDKVKQFSEWFRGLDDSTKKTITTVLLLVAAIGPLLIAVGKGIALAGQVMTYAPAITGAISGIGALITGTAIPAVTGVIAAVAPFLPLIAAVVAGIAAVIAIVKNWDTISQALADTWESVKTRVSDSWEAMKRAVSDKFDAIKRTITDKINGARDAVKSAIEKIKGFFNFQWSLPKIKMPHFTIQGSFSLNPPSVPHFAVDWFKKAYDEAYLLNSPTIFGAAGGRLLGGGDGAGSEAVVGTDKLMGMIREAVGQQGDITIPVYVGGSFFGRQVVTAEQIHNYRSGGR